MKLGNRSDDDESTGQDRHPRSSSYAPASDKQRLATKPWVMSATGYTKAYHVHTDLDEMDWFRRYFNDAAEVIDQHYGKGYFGLRLEWGFVQRGDEEVKAIIVRERPGGQWAGLLEYLEATDTTLTSKQPAALSDEERALRMAVRDKINQMGLSLKDIVGADPRFNHRPTAPPDSTVESYGPEDWKFMSDFLFIVRIPEKDLEYQAKAYDGWWNRKGRKKVAFQNIRSRIAPFS